jgi:hypothetical protein
VTAASTKNHDQRGCNLLGFLNLSIYRKETKILNAWDWYEMSFCVMIMGLFQLVKSLVVSINWVVNFVK